MRYYKLKALSVSALGNRVLRKEENKTYPETYWVEGRAEELVSLGFLVRVGEEGKVEKKEQPKKEAVKEMVVKEEEDKSLMDGIQDSFNSGEEEETTPEPKGLSEKEALMGEAIALAERKGIRKPHPQTGAKKLKKFIEENK